MGVDVTAVNVALPSLERDLSAGVSGLQWTIDAYTVVIAIGQPADARRLDGRTASAASASSSPA